MSRLTRVLPFLLCGLLLTGCRIDLDTALYVGDALGTQTLSFPARLRFQVPSCSADKLEQHKRQVLALFSANSRARVTGCEMDGFESLLGVQFVAAIGNQRPDYDVIFLRERAPDSATITLRMALDDAFRDRIERLLDDNHQSLSFDKLNLTFRLHNDARTTVGYRLEAGWIDGVPRQPAQGMLQRREEIEVRTPDVVADLLIRGQTPIILQLAPDAVIPGAPGVAATAEPPADASVLPSPAGTSSPAPTSDPATASSAADGNGPPPADAPPADAPLVIPGLDITLPDDAADARIMATLLQPLHTLAARDGVTLSTAEPIRLTRDGDQRRLRIAQLTLTDSDGDALLLGDWQYDITPEGPHAFRYRLDAPRHIRLQEQGKTVGHLRQTGPGCEGRYLLDLPVHWSCTLTDLTLTPEGGTTTAAPLQIRELTWQQTTELADTRLDSVAQQEISGVVINLPDGRGLTVERASLDSRVADVPLAQIERLQALTQNANDSPSDEQKAAAAALLMDLLSEITLTGNYELEGVSFVQGGSRGLVLERLALTLGHGPRAGHGRLNTRLELAGLTSPAMRLSPAMQPLATQLAITLDGLPWRPLAQALRNGGAAALDDTPNAWVEQALQRPEALPIVLAIDTFTLNAASMTVELTGSLDISALQSTAAADADNADAVAGRFAGQVRGVDGWIADNPEVAQQDPRILGLNAMLKLFGRAAGQDVLDYDIVVGADRKVRINALALP